jgi:cytochrome c-type biogenesis protein CcmH
MRRSARRSARRTVSRGVGRLALAATLLVILPRALRAQEPAPGASGQTTVAPPPGVDTLLDARVKTVASRLRCPVCQGESIQDSPAELSGQMKLLVREQLASGRSEQQVFDYFTQKYGQWILLEPKAEGINLLVYWLPVVFLVVGGGGVAMAVKKWSRPVDPAVAAEPAVQSPDDDSAR